MQGSAPPAAVEPEQQEPDPEWEVVEAIAALRLQSEETQPVPPQRERPTEARAEHAERPRPRPENQRPDNRRPENRRPENQRPLFDEEEDRALWAAYRRGQNIPHPLPSEWRVYAVWAGSKHGRGVHAGPHPATWDAIVLRLEAGGYIYHLGSRLKRFETIDAAVARYLHEARRHTAPDPPTIFLWH